MTPEALALVRAAAVGHATCNLLAKKTGGAGKHFVLLSSLLVALLWAPLGLWAALTETVRWRKVAWAVVLASARVHLLYFRTLLRGYAVADLTVVYPVARGSGLRWGGLTGAFIAGYTVIDGHAVKVLLISPILVDDVGNALRVPMMLPFACAIRPVSRRPAASSGAARWPWRRWARSATSWCCTPCAWSC